MVEITGTGRIRMKRSITVSMMPITKKNRSKLRQCLLMVGFQKDWTGRQTRMSVSPAPRNQMATTTMEINATRLKVSVAKMRRYNHRIDILRAATVMK